MTWLVKNRSRVEILYDIVAASRSSAKKTHLMYKSNLSFKQLRLYLDFLVQRGLVQESKGDDSEDSGRTYSPTPKGLEFLSLFQELQGFMGMYRAVDSAAPPAALETQPLPAVSEILAPLQ